MDLAEQVPALHGDGAAQLGEVEGARDPVGLRIVDKARQGHREAFTVFLLSSACDVSAEDFFQNVCWNVNVVFRFLCKIILRSERSVSYLFEIFQGLIKLEMKLNKVPLTETKAGPPAPLLGHKAIAIRDKLVLDEIFSSFSVSLGQVLQVKHIVLKRPIIHGHSI